MGDSARLAHVVAQEVGVNVSAHLLETSEAAAASDGNTVAYELLLRDVDKQSSDILSDVVLPLASLAVVVACTLFLGSSDMLAKLGSVVGAGSAAPLGLLVGLLFISEVSRAAVASSCGARLTPPFFVPSPQFGLLGTLRGTEKPLPSREASVLVGLSAPLAMAFSSLLLLLWGALVSPDAAGADISSNAGGLIELAKRSTWLFAALPSTHCDAFTFAGLQGLLISGLALMPQSPDGHLVWRSLHGRDMANKAAELVTYLWLILGLASDALYGSYWAALPIVWYVVLTNVSPRHSSPPMEELSPVKPALTQVATVAAGLALIITAPLPLHEIAKAVQW